MENQAAIREDTYGRVLVRDFNDFDELSDCLGGLDFEIRQLDTGPFEGRLEQLQTRHAVLARGESERTLEQRGMTASNAWTFVIPSPDCSPFIWRGEHVSPNDIALLGPDMEMDALSRDGFSVFAFSISAEHLADTADEMAAPLARRLGQSAVLRGSNARARPLAHLLRDILNQAVDGSSIGGASDAEHRLEREATQGLIDCLLPEDESRQSAQTALRREVFDRARAYVVSMKDEPVTVESLCEAVRTNQRTLHRAFHKNCGVSPKAYLKAYRLNGVRKQLRRSGPQSGTVGTAANGWGFWHMGQFAADYRSQFGELPSETLARRAVG